MDNNTNAKSNNFGISNEAINAAKKGDKKALLNQLSSDDIKKINSVLNDKQKLEDILKSPQAAAIFKALGGKNG